MLDILARERILIAIAEIFSFPRTKLRSWYYGVALNVQSLNVGGKVVVRGSKDIAIGSGFSSHGDLWIEAVTSYAGHRYYPQITIGSNVRLSDRVHLSAIDRIRIGDDVLIGSNVYIGDHNHGGYGRNIQTGPGLAPACRPLIGNGGIDIGNRVFLADNVVVLGGVTIGDGTIVGANSVVTKNLPANCIAIGCPAKIIKRFDDASQKWLSQ